MVDTTVTILGNLTKDPDFSITGNGIPRASFRVASTERRFDRTTGRYADGNTVYLSVTCWRDLAANVGEVLRRGDPVVVVGRLRQRDYLDRNGTTVTATDVDADVVSVDLRRGTTGRFTRPVRQAATTDAFVADAGTGDPAAAPEPTAGLSASPDAAGPGTGSVDLPVGGELVAAGVEPPF